MRLLLDTNALLHWHAGKMSPAAVRVVRRAENVSVSAVSAWEIAIKRALGKLTLRDSVADLAEQYGFETLPATVGHGDAVRALPLHHFDPFDRLLIAQALEEGMVILTSDRVFEAYRVPVEWL